MFNPSLPVIYYWVKPTLFQPLLASSESLRKKTSFYLLETNQSDHLSEHCPQALRGPMGSMRLEGPSTSGSFCAQAWCSWTLNCFLDLFWLFHRHSYCLSRPKRPGKSNDNMLPGQHFSDDRWQVTDRWGPGMLPWKTPLISTGTVALNTKQDLNKDLMGAQLDGYSVGGGAPVKQFCLCSRLAGSRQTLVCWFPL